MKKTILISIGVLFVLATIGIWAYLFIFGTPTSTGEVFAKFGFAEDTVETPREVSTNTATEEKPAGETPAPKKLRQLTTRPVAGATFTGTGILYAEQGTGHLYHINLTTGSETLISGTTIVGTREAVFSNGGAYVAITAATEKGTETVMGTVTLEGGSGGLEGVALPLGATQVSFGTATGTVTYIIKSASGATGYSYTIGKKDPSVLFTIPLNDIRVLWGKTPYVYTTPTNIQTGYMYTLTKNELGYVSDGGKGLMGLTYDGGVITTTHVNNIVSSKAIQKVGDVIDLPLPLITEKCIQHAVHKKAFYCGVPSNIEVGTFPDDWYMGVISYSDILWSIDVEGGEATMLSNFLSESGREIDVSTIGTNADDTRIYMINKNDNTLWLFDTTVQ